MVTPKRDRDARPFQFEFDQLWEIYPRKKDRAAAQRAAIALLRAGVPFADLLAATQIYAVERAGQDETFTKHAKTFYEQNGAWRECFVTLNHIKEDRETDANERFSHEELEAEMRAEFVMNSNTSGTPS